MNNSLELDNQTNNRMLPQTPQKTKKVLIIAHNHPNFFPGGAEIVAYDLFKCIKKTTEYQPFFLAATSAVSRKHHTGTPFQMLVDAPDEMIFWGDAFDYFYQSQKILNFLYIDFKEFLQQLQPDVIHFHHTMRIGLEAIQVAKQTLPNVKIVYTLHEFILICHHNGQMVRKPSYELCESASPNQCHKCFPEFSPQQFKMREAFIKAHLDHVDQFISPSHFLAKRFVDWGIPEEKMTVLENGRQLSEAVPPRPLPPGGKRNVFGYFGQIHSFKGVNLIFQAVEHLINQDFTDFRIELFGNIPSGFAEFEKEFYEFMEKYKDNVFYHGRYNQEEMVELIQLVDWVIVPSIWWENSPLVIQEVFMHKRPIICSNIGGMSEKVEHEVTGLHFRARNPASLAKTIIEATLNNDKWQILRGKIEKRFSITDSTQCHLKIYENLGLTSKL